MSDAASQTIRRQRFSQEVTAVVTIAVRDVTLALKSPATLAMSFAMPIIMLGMLGGSLAQNMAAGLNFHYGRFMLVGMLVNMLFMITNVGISSLAEDHTTDFPQEMMISPISRYSIILGKIVGSSFGAILSMVGTLAVGLLMGISLSIWQLLLFFALSPLVCFVSGALTVLIIGAVKSTKTANMMVSLIVSAQMFLSGAMIPISNSSGVLLILSRLMPMTYCLDLARAIVYSGTTEYADIVMFGPLINFVAITVISLACMLTGTFLFARSEKNR